MSQEVFVSVSVEMDQPVSASVDTDFHISAVVDPPAHIVIGVAEKGPKGDPGVGVLDEMSQDFLLLYRASKL